MTNRQQNRRCTQIGNQDGHNPLP